MQVRVIMSLIAGLFVASGLISHRGLGAELLEGIVGNLLLQRRGGSKLILSSSSHALEPGEEMLFKFGGCSEFRLPVTSSMHSSRVWYY